VNNRDLNFPSRGSLCIDSAGRDLNYAPKIDIEQGFKNYYQWLVNPTYQTK
jgi:nucleoside-diphosphate-sugar epimerase